MKMRVVKSGQIKLKNEHRDHLGQGESEKIIWHYYYLTRAKFGGNTFKEHFRFLFGRP